MGEALERSSGGISGTRVQWDVITVQNGKTPFRVKSLVYRQSQVFLVSLVSQWQVKYAHSRCSSSPLLFSAATQQCTLWPRQLIWQLQALTICFQYPNMRVYLSIEQQYQFITSNWTSSTAQRKPPSHARFLFLIYPSIVKYTGRYRDSCMLSSWWYDTASFNCNCHSSERCTLWLLTDSQHDICFTRRLNS